MAQTKKFRFNILDFVIIIVAVACLIGLFARDEVAQTLTKKDEEAVVTFRVTMMLNSTIEKCLIPGDAFYCNLIKGEFGTLSEEPMIITPSRTVLSDKSGTPISVELPYRSDIKGKMISRGYWNGESFFAGGNTRLVPGEEYAVFSENRRMNIKIVSVDPAK